MSTISLASGSRSYAVAQLGRQLQRLVDRVVAAQDRGRIHLAETIPDRRREPEDAGGVADPLLALDRLERDDLGDVVGAVLVASRTG